MSDAVQLSYCAAEVKRADPDRFLCALLAPPAAREHLCTLYAFDLELAKVGEVTTQPVTGLIRLQWWRETLDAIGVGEVRRHPVAEALAATLGGTAADPDLLRRAIDAREVDVDPDPPADLATLERYAAETAGNVAEAGVQALLGRHGPAADAARHVGTAWGLVGGLRATQARRVRGRTGLPADLLRGAGLGVEAVQEGRMRPELAPVVAAVAERARERLRSARMLQRAVPRAGLPVLLQARLAAHYLRALERLGHDPFALADVPRPPLAPLTLAARAWLGSY